jgi:feruloyl esterase
MATSRPTSDSEIKMEIWLPVDGWNNRLEETGNGAFGSALQYNSMAEGVVKDYAVAGNNPGHEGNDGDFAFGHPEKLIDWGYRAVHETTVTAKAVVAAYYGSPAKYSYWNSCSTGGRQGLIAAEYYPNDFDGIAAGDAANPMTRLQSSTLWGNLAVNKSPESVIPEAKVAMYKKAVLDACDAADGIKDGIINNPLACNFDPKMLLCKSGDAPDCFTAPQLEALQKVIDGPKNPRTGEEVFPGWHVGTLPGNFVWGPKPEQVSIDIFRGLFQDPSWDYHNIDFDKDIARSDKLGNNVVNAVDETRLKTLFAHGGKMLLYHGWNDGSIPPLSAIEYYNKAVAANGGVSKTYDSVRLFMIPGGNHCGPGDGPAVFDKLDVISEWVERGKAPDEIIASHLTAGNSGTADRTRPLCPYPQIAKYKGTGSTDEAQNFVCAAP